MSNATAEDQSDSHSPNHSAMPPQELVVLISSDDEPEEGELEEDESGTIPCTDSPSRQPAATVDLDDLLGTIDRNNAPAETQRSVLGKRARSESPEIVLPADLLEEIRTANGLYGAECVEHYGSPAVFRITFSKRPVLRVLVSFPADYPAAPPTLSPVEGTNETFAKIGRDIVKDTPSGKPCLVELVRRLVAEGSTLSGGRPLPASHRAAQDQLESVYHPGGFPSEREFERQLQLIKSTVPDYPPPLPEFESHDNLNTAFITETYARHVFRTERRMIEGNQRLEFLGDAILEALISAVMMDKYQLNEQGMTSLAHILRSNRLFAQLYKAYELDLKTRAAPGERRSHFKEQADVFEAVAGGLYLDGVNEDDGWQKLVRWITPLIEPWVDWCLERSPQSDRDRWVTYNRFKLTDGEATQKPDPKRARVAVAQKPKPKQKRNGAKKQPSSSRAGLRPGAKKGTTQPTKQKGKGKEPATSQKSPTSFSVASGDTPAAGSPPYSSAQRPATSSSSEAAGPAGGMFAAPATADLAFGTATGFPGFSAGGGPAYPPRK